MAGRGNDASYILALCAFVLSALSFFGVVFWWLSSPAERDTDAIAWSMSVLQTLLAVVALVGFWAVRGAAVAQARETAEVEARKVAEVEAPKTAERIAQRTARETTEAYLVSQYGTVRADTGESLADALDANGASDGQD